ncbi:MAG: hypothetical protein AB7O67_01130 [Vicinamibacterales bacterium]
MRRMGLMAGTFVLGLVFLGPGLLTVGARQHDETLHEAMEKAGPAFGMLRKAMDGTNANMASENAATLKQVFADTETVFKAMDKADAVEWAQGAGKTAATIQEQVGAGNWDAAKASAGELGKFCQGCHGKYREKGEDGKWRLKPGN